MKEYALVVIGSGSAMNIVSAWMNAHPGKKVAVIDKDEPGGICLTRGCIPSKLLLYPAELVRVIEGAAKFGMEVQIKKVPFDRVMDRMREKIRPEIESIRRGLSHTPHLDYYPAPAEFTAPGTLRVGSETIQGEMIFLTTGSRPLIPPVQGLEEAGYLTSDTVLQIRELPASIAVIGGGYIAAEYGHFFSAMGSRVTILGRNPQFLPEEEPEVSTLAAREMSRYLTLLTNHEVLKAARSGERKRVTVRERSQNREKELVFDELLVAAGRGPNTDLLHPEKGNIQTDGQGWIAVNEYLETSAPGVWAFGDANGKYPFKHKANYESLVVYHNAVLGEKVKADYHAVPHAVFSCPEIASVGMKEKQAVKGYGAQGILIGMYRYEDTGKGEAMAVKDYFVKVIVENASRRILGAHIVGPQASVLIQEIVNAMAGPGKVETITMPMHIHPALSEVVDRACHSLMPPAHYRHVLKENLGL